ncbi:MAG: hypothetical protein IT170_03760 [Bryobacterales bacterium]|nr:hypothetical protein [Bryobacterales bacterium]
MPAKKPGKFDATKEIKRLARERVGAVPPSRVEEEPKAAKKAKHKKKWEELEGED